MFSYLQIKKKIKRKNICDLLCKPIHCNASDWELSLWMWKSLHHCKHWFYCPFFNGMEINVTTTTVSMERVHEKRSLSSGASRSRYSIILRGSPPRLQNRIEIWMIMLKCWHVETCIRGPIKYYKSVRVC